MAKNVKFPKPSKRYAGKSRVILWRWNYKQYTVMTALGRKKRG